MLLYADTSALARAYFVDEADHEALRSLLLDGPDGVVVSELVRLELTTTTMSAARAGRLPRPELVLAAFDVDCREGGPLAMIGLDPERILPVVHHLLLAHPLRTLDALHLAIALVELPELAAGEEIGFVTRDRRQAEAADAEGLVLVG